MKPLKTPLGKAVRKHVAERKAARWLGEWVCMEKGRSLSRNYFAGYLHCTYYSTRGSMYHEFADTAIELAKKLGMK